MLRLGTLIPMIAPMRFGVCTSTENSLAVKRAGWDFVEELVQTTLQGHLPNSDWHGLARAQRSALPVIAYEEGGVCEFIENGRTGLLSAAESVDGLARSIYTLLQSPEQAKAMGQASRERVEVRQRDFTFYRDEVRPA